uniref:Uncharacterized protein n=1 Tax=Gopherus agassizii TaxID=38772 RepID=A0A452GS82_9SAUR
MPLAAAGPAHLVRCGQKDELYRSGLRSGASGTENLAYLTTDTPSHTHTQLALIVENLIRYQRLNGL